MTKNLYFVIFIALSAVLSLTSCTDEKKEMIESLNYKKACELKEFSTAYEIVDLLKKKTSEAKVEWERQGGSFLPKYSIEKEALEKYKEAELLSEEAERYVVLQESLIVLESEGSNGLTRVVGIAKEHNAESWLYLELLDVFNKIGDKELAGKFEDLTTLTPEILSISGPLNGYFEVEDTKIKFAKSERISYRPRINFRIKRVKEGMPRQFNNKYSRIHFIVNFLDKDGTSQESDNYELYDTKQLLQTNVGDYYTFGFYVENEKAHKLKKFNISSTIE